MQEQVEQGTSGESHQKIKSKFKSGLLKQILLKTNRIKMLFTF